VEDYRLELLVADVLGMADALGRDRFHLVGHDWGAVVAWAVAARAPERLLSFTALSVPHPDPYAADQGDASTCQYEASAYIEFLTTEGSERSLLANDAASLRMLFPDFPDEVVDEYVEVFASGDTLRAATDWYRANCQGRQLVSELVPLGAVSVDTVMVWSDGDAALCREPVDATGALVSAAYRLEILEGVDHWIPERVPEVVNPWLLEHLAGR
jgi:pimeloyl-ACP methyl ester carboxylesterase